MFQRQTLILLAMASGLTGPMTAWADLTLTGRSALSALGRTTAGQEVLQIKGDRLRRDVMDRGRAFSFLFDLEGRRITVIDHGLKVAEVHSTKDLKASENLATKAGFDMNLSKTGRKHDLQSWDCHEHKLDVTMPAELGADKVTFKLDGTVWLAKGTKEQKEMATFSKAATSPEFLVGLPAVAKITEVQALAFGEAIRRLAGMGTLCAMDVQSQYEGTGRMVELSRKVPTRMILTYESYTPSPIQTEAFVIPGGYRVIQK